MRVHSDGGQAQTHHFRFRSAARLAADKYMNKMLVFHELLLQIAEYHQCLATVQHYHLIIWFLLYDPKLVLRKPLSYEGSLWMTEQWHITQSGSLWLHVHNTLSCMSVLLVTRSSQEVSCSCSERCSLRQNKHLTPSGSLELKRRE